LQAAAIIATTTANNPADRDPDATHARARSITPITSPSKDDLCRPIRGADVRGSFGTVVIMMP
jgi:hypothetical protein